MCVHDASRIAIDGSRVTLQIVASLTDDSRGVIYDGKMFIVQDTGWVLAYEQNFYNITKQSFCHDTQQSDTQHNGTQHNGTQHDTQHNDT